ncbi:MAG: nucleotidyltransferase family protein [Proteobacteria bacterium]|nr:nucleotidyltransferase family protein [Pseudomonadota bacterium]
MDEFLEKLIGSDRELPKFTQDSQIIQQGLAPISALNNRSIAVQKAHLLETVKLKNWIQKAHVLFNALTEQQIEFLTFKGFAFTFLLYKKTHLRPYSDIDIIIKQSDYDTVKTILVQLGYQQHPSRQGSFVSFQNSFLYNVDTIDKGTPHTVIDLHWQINNRIEFHKHFDFSSLFENAQSLHFDNTEFKTLSNIDAFILGCFHYHAHRPEDRKHIWLYDLALLWNKMDSNEQKNCLAKATAKKQSAIVIYTLNLINLTFLNCFKMDFNNKILNNEATEHYLKPRAKKIVDIRARLKNISGITNKLKFINEYVFQSTEYVIKRYSLKSNQWVYLYYPKMWLEDIMKLLK